VIILLGVRWAENVARVGQTQIDQRMAGWIGIDYMCVSEREMHIIFWPENLKEEATQKT